MGAISDGRRRLELRARVRIGAAADNFLVLVDPSVSADHARVEWRQGRWYVVDLDSRNGTWVHRRGAEGRVELRQVEGRLELQRGDVLVFGEDGESWELCDAGPPVVSARHVQTGAELFGGPGWLSDPEDRWHLALEDGAWRLMVGAEEHEVADEGLIDGVWRVALPNLRETADARTQYSVHKANFRFLAPMGDGDVALTVEQDGRAIVLEPRLLWRLLCYLAEARQEDPEGGWVPLRRLARDLLKEDEDVDATDRAVKRVDVYLSRIRAELASRRVLDASAVVEGRDGARRIGVAAERIEVTFVEGEVARGRRRRGA
jgi:hypothetical protein